MRCEARLEGPIYKEDPKTGEKILTAKGWRNEDGSEKPGGVYGNVDELYESWGFNPDNDSVEGLHDKLWVINQAGRNLEYDPKWAPRADIALPVLQCIFASTSSTVRCSAHRNGEYNFLKVKEFVHAKAIAGPQKCCHPRCTICGTFRPSAREFSQIRDLQRCRRTGKMGPSQLLDLDHFESLLLNISLGE